MRFMIMHRTNSHWEAGAVPSSDLVARVGKMIGEMVNAGVLQGAEGLRASSQGARVTFRPGGPAIENGPFEGANELPAGFSILRTASLPEAIDWAVQQAALLADEQVDIRPVTEPWDIGMAPSPEAVTTRRYMAMRKATAATERGDALPADRRAAWSRFLADTTGRGVHRVSETLRPSRRGRRYRNSRDGISVFDGPFVETKELLGGYVIVAADSLEAADGWARRYITTVGAEEVDLREVE